ncbi:MAG: flavin reductase family protein [Dysgonomonas sp.]
MEHFKEIGIKNINLTAFDIKSKWMLVSAAKPDGSVNTMTASWGGFGIMWNKEVVWVVIRPQRYTKEFVDSADSFSLSFFNKSYQKKALSYLGKVSGRDENKIEKSGLTVLKDESGVPFFDEAETVIIARKLYAQPMAEQFFIDKKPIADWYPEKDFHVYYIAEITKVLKKDDSLLHTLDNIIL